MLSEKRVDACLVKGIAFVNGSDLGSIGDMPKEAVGSSFCAEHVRNGCIDMFALDNLDRWALADPSDVARFSDWRCVGIDSIL